MVLGEGLETPIQLIYLLTLLGFLGVGAYLVVRQVLIRRELDEGAKGLGERIRTGEATCEVGWAVRRCCWDGWGGCMHAAPPHAGHACNASAVAASARASGPQLHVDA